VGEGGCGALREGKNSLRSWMSRCGRRIEAERASVRAAPVAFTTPMRRRRSLLMGVIGGAARHAPNRPAQRIAPASFPSNPPPGAAPGVEPPCRTAYTRHFAGDGQPLNPFRVSSRPRYRVTLFTLVPKRSTASSHCPGRFCRCSRVGGTIFPHLCPT
jgi:hypothetical protein